MTERREQGDCITLSGIFVEGVHGVLEAEHHQPQNFIVDVSLWFDSRRAARQDDIGATIDYSHVTQKVLEVVRGQSVALIERLAYRIAMSVLADARIAAVEVTVHKPQAPLTVRFDDVSIKIYRTREEYLAESTRLSAELSAQPLAPRRAVLSLGANLGDPVRTLRAAVAGLYEHPELSGLRVSPLVRTRPVLAPGQTPQPDYYNAVVSLESRLSGAELLDLAHQLEDSAGRERPYRWAPRTLDVDIVQVDGLESSDSRLTLPHPRAATRAFVLVPWAALDSQAQLQGHSVVELARAARDAKGVLGIWEDWLSVTARSDAAGEVRPSVEQREFAAPASTAAAAVVRPSRSEKQGEVEEYCGGDFGLPSWKAVLPETVSAVRIVDDSGVDITYPEEPAETL